LKKTSFFLLLLLLQHKAKLLLARQLSSAAKHGIIKIAEISQMLFCSLGLPACCQCCIEIFVYIGIDTTFVAIIVYYQKKRSLLALCACALLRLQVSISFKEPE